MKKRKVRIVGERGKVRLELVPYAALAEEAKAFDHGNRKPGRSKYNWRRDRVSVSDQIGGALRHIQRFNDGQDVDPRSLAHELGHARARLGVIIDAFAARTIIDDRVKLPRQTKRSRK
jgi:hypothetical protein